MRRDALGCYGNPDVRTPHMDRLADTGVRFDRACSTYPICVPFRFTLMTGETAHSRLIPGIEFRMSPAEYTLADAFNAADYHTAYVGKWHLYGDHGLDILGKHWPYDSSCAIPLIVVDPRNPQRAGASSVEPVNAEDLFPTLLGLAGLHPPGPRPGMDMAPILSGQAGQLPRDGILLEYDHDHMPGWPWYEQQWRAFVSRRYKYVALGPPSGAKPWMLFDLDGDPHELNNLLHDPYDPPEPYYSLFDPADVPEPIPATWPENGSPTLEMNWKFGPAPGFGSIARDPEALRKLRAVYHGSLKLIDDQLVRVLHCLEEQGVADNTGSSSPLTTATCLVTMP